jgi:Toprim domain
LRVSLDQEIAATLAAFKPAPPAPEPAPEPPSAFVREQIARVVAGLVPILSSPGEAYLRDVRRIDTGTIADVLERTGAIGWHESVLFRETDHPLDGKRIGAIIAIMADPLTAEPTGGISRTYVHNGKKVVKAKGLGPAGIVRLSPDDEVTHGLHISEGLESALAAMSIGFRPMWSTGSTVLMASLPALPGVEALTILADHDESGAGERAAREAGRRWRDAGRQVRLVMPKQPGDVNDIIMRGAA